MLSSLLAMASVGCADHAPSRFAVVVRVESDPGKPLAGAHLTTQGRPLGVSDAEGKVALALPGKAGDAMTIETRCPDGFRAPDAPLSVVMRPTAEQKSPEFRVACQPSKRRVVLSVRAQNGANLPVRYLGREIARTDPTGAAHAMLEAAPGETLTVTLATTAPEHARLMPQNPELKLVVPERDEIVVFDQTFALPPPPPQKRRHHRHREPKGPAKIVGPRRT
ncbi:MAG: hypothetical protein ABW252_17790 [Polyangiales bacterium]